MDSMLKTPKIQMALCLSAIAFTALLYTKSPATFITVVLIILSAVILDYFLTRLRRIPAFLLSAAIVSGLIVSLIFSQHPVWYEVLAAISFAIISKNFLCIENRHIFNPAAFGMVCAGFIFHRSVSWWGASFQTPEYTIMALVAFVVLLSPGYVSMIRLQRFRITGSFFLVYILAIGFVQFLHHSFDLTTLILNTLLNPATLFFSIVMLPEPMTTPNTHTRQLLFGTSVALISVTSGFIGSVFIPDPLLIGLLVSNALFFKFT